MLEEMKWMDRIRHRSTVLELYSINPYVLTSGDTCEQLDTTWKWMRRAVKEMSAFYITYGYILTAIKCC